jgi:hypothetical protein
MLCMMRAYGTVILENETNKSEMKGLKICVFYCM